MALKHVTQAEYDEEYAQLTTDYNTRPFIYVSGPFSSDDNIHGVERNILAASEIAATAYQKGWAVHCPHKNNKDFQHLKGLTWKDWMESDFKIVSRCDALLMIPGWEKSPGARMERQFAQDRGLPVYEFPNIPDGKEFSARRAEA
jgi:hypothetical protein